MVSVPAFGAGIPNLDEMGIDPWGELDGLFSTDVVTVSDPADMGLVGSEADYEGEGVEVYSLGDDVVIMPLALPSGDYDFKAVSPSGSTILRYYVGNRDSVNMSNAEYTFSRGFNPVMASPGSGEGYNVRMYNQGYLEFTSSVSYSATGNSTLYLNGSLALYPVIRYDGGAAMEYVYFSDGNFKVQLLLNGKPYGSVVSGATRLSYDNFAIDLSKVGNVSSVGIRVTFVKGQVLSSGSTVTDAMFGFMVSDTLSLISDETGGDNGETVGLLGSIIEFLTSIVNGITNVAQQIAHLPGLIADEIMGRIRSLFVPDEAEITALKDKYMTLLEERLGFLWQAMTFITDFASSFVEGLTNASDYTFHFPGLSLTLPEGTYQVIEAQDVDFNNGLMDIVRPVAGTIVSFVVVLNFLRVSEDMAIAVVSGKSYFDFLKGGGGNE